jgi:type IV pilus assembly protein PilO
MKLTVPKWTNVRITTLHWHYAGVGLLCLLNLGLAARLVYAWRGAAAGNTARLQQQEMEYRTIQLKTKPLRGLDKKIAQAQVDEKAFYEKRFPDSYSEVQTELGKLAVKNNVLLNRVQYAQGKPNEGVSMILMEASLSGDYAPVVRFINDLERDRIFFLISGIALSGQQGGIVSLRMRLQTYLRDTTDSGATVRGAYPPVIAHTAIIVPSASAKHSAAGRR